MSEHATTLRIRNTDNTNPAIIHDSLSLDDLFDAEASWAPVRVRMIQELTRRGIPRTSWPESLHWNWAKKAAELTPDRLGALGDVRVFGISTANDWEGMQLAKAAGHMTKLKSVGRELVYIEYVESAPWNWEVAQIKQEARYRGAGMQLVEMAVRWSLQLGFHGRIGLHSLQQAEDFYRRRCGMTDLGPDSDWRYQKMRYFEFSDDQAREFLEGRP